MPEERRQWRCRYTEDRIGGIEETDDGGYQCWIEPAEGPRIAIWRADACAARTLDEARKCADEIVGEVGAWRGPHDGRARLE